MYKQLRYIHMYTQFTHLEPKVYIHMYVYCVHTHTYVSVRGYVRVVADVWQVNECV